jgi:hypothetical protein
MKRIPSFCKIIACELQLRVHSATTAVGTPGTQQSWAAVLELHREGDKVDMQVGEWSWRMSFLNFKLLLNCWMPLGILPGSTTAKPFFRFEDILVCLTINPV